VGKIAFRRICSNLIKKIALRDSNGDVLINEKGEALTSNHLNKTARFLNLILNLIEGGINGHQKNINRS